MNRPDAAGSHSGRWAITPSPCLRGLVALITIISTAALGAVQPARTARTTTGIAYDIQGKGPVVVLVSGSNLDRRMWTREARWLASDHTVVRYDLRAHGASDTATIPFRHVDDLIALLNEIGIQKATLIGLSAGSAIALDAALAEPSRVDRLVLVGPTVSGLFASPVTVHCGISCGAAGARLREGGRSAARLVGVRGPA
jgi:pimeloyl-ACP methyl ester carboxylesterase